MKIVALAAFIPLVSSCYTSTHSGEDLGLDAYDAQPHFDADAIIDRPPDHMYELPDIPSVDADAVFDTPLSEWDAPVDMGPGDMDGFSNSIMFEAPGLYEFVVPYGWKGKPTT